MKMNLLLNFFHVPENATENSTPEKVIHNFDELITFFEGLDEEKTSRL